MSKLNINRKLFLEQEELNKFQEFLEDSISENAIIGNTNSWGILKTDFSEDTDFKVEIGSNAGTIKINKDINKAFTVDAKRIYQEAIDNISVTDDDSWYWVRISHEYSNLEPGTVEINVSGEVSGIGTEFLSVLRGQGTKVPTKIKFIKSDGSEPVNNSYYEVVDVIDDSNCVLTSAIDFTAENDLKIIVLGSTPIGEAISTTQEQGIFQYDSCNIELVAEVIEDTAPTTGYVENETFYLARIKNNSGVVTIQDKRTDYWNFNIAGLTDKLSASNNLSDVEDVNLSLTNLGFTTVGKNLRNLDVITSVGYLSINVDGTVNILNDEDFISSLNSALSNIFLKKSDNLYSLEDKAASRNNLDVYSKSDVYTKIESGNNFLFKSQNLYDLDNVATARNNLNVYSKDDTYTKSGVDDRIGMRLRLRATVDSTGTATKQGGDLSVSANKDETGTYTVTHNLGVGATSYQVLAYVSDTDSARKNVKVCAINNSINSFVIYFADDVSLNDVDFTFSLIQFLV